MEQGQQRQPALGLSVAQISSGALASVTAAVVASYFGISGTLIGAAITSVVATLGGALYKQSIEQAQPTDRCGDARGHFISRRSATPPLALGTEQRRDRPCLRAGTRLDHGIRGGREETDGVAARSHGSR